MSTDQITVARVAAVDEASAQLATIKADIAELMFRRENLIATTHAELIAAGMDVIATRVDRRSEPHRLHVGDRVRCTRILERNRSDVRFRKHEPEDHHRSNIWGIFDEDRSSGPLLCHYDGVYEILVIDSPAPDDTHDIEDDILMVRVDEDDDVVGHRRSIAKLRNLARHDQIRVRVRDRSVALVDPMDTVVHEGDVISAFKWLLGIDAD